MEDINWKTTEYRAGSKESQGLTANMVTVADFVCKSAFDTNLSDGKWTHVSSSSIARALRVSPTTIVNNIDKLCRNGQLVRAKCGCLSPSSSFLHFQYDGRWPCLSDNHWGLSGKCENPPNHGVLSDNKKVKNTRIYLMVDEHTGLIKIGRAKKPSTREKTLQGQIPLLKMIGHWPGKESDEAHLHNLFADKRVRGEWFRLANADVETTINYLKNKEA